MPTKHKADQPQGNLAEQAIVYLLDLPSALGGCSQEGIF
jgi:hypothetical protein